MVRYNDNKIHLNSVKIFIYIEVQSLGSFLLSYAKNCEKRLDFSFIHIYVESWSSTWLPETCLRDYYCLYK